MKSLLFCTIAVLPFLAYGQMIVRLETKTADVEDAGMLIGGSISLEMLMADATFCRIQELSSDGFNFQQGKIDVFVGADLGGCANFTAPGGEISRVTLSHGKVDH